MAILSYPNPVDSGVLCIILANTAISISIFKEIVCSILHVIGIHIKSWEEFSVESSDSSEYCASPSESYIGKFRSRTPAIQYDSIFLFDCPKQECSICLTELEPTSEVNRLSCGHIFHKLCLEKWFKYWNATCPLCRNYLMPQETEEYDSPIELGSNGHAATHESLVSVESAPEGTCMCRWRTQATVSYTCRLSQGHW